LTSSFEDPTRESEFSTDPALAGHSEKYAEQMKTWNGKITEFLDWLNSTETESLSRQLVAMDKPESEFEGVSNEARKITNIAKDLASLRETINGIINALNRQTPNANDI